MGRLGTILGSSVAAPDGASIVDIAGRHGAVLRRHGDAGAYRLPHRIDHAANLRRLVAQGCDRVLAICSVGSLKLEIGVGAFVCPDDFIALQVRVTTFDDIRGHATAGFDSEWRARVLAAWPGGAGELRDGGVYWQTNGPRFETPAEVRLIAEHADFVGMTLASECIVAGELGLPYAAVCVVDNLANGLAAQPLTPEELAARPRAQRGAATGRPRSRLAGAGLSALTVTEACLDGETVGVRCIDGTIAAIGPNVMAEPGDETIDAAEAPLVPALVNGHGHAAMTLFRGYGGDLPLMRWLREKIWPVEAKLEPEDVYWGTRLACAEMIRTGTGRFWDMYWHPEASARAVEDAGLGATIGGPLFDADGNTEGTKQRVLGELDALAGRSAAIDAALAPHSIYTVSEELLRWTAETAAERELPVQIHLSETEDEVEECVADHGVRPAAYLDRLGLLGERTLLAHGVWLDRAELELIAERGATVVANPVANMKLAVGGTFPYPAAREAGVAVGLGTDGAGSNDSLDLFADLKAFALSQRHTAGDPTVVVADEALRIAAGAASPCWRAATSRSAWAPPPTSSYCAATRPSWGSATSRRT